jgi:hypothetical protein
MKIQASTKSESKDGTTKDLRLCLDVCIEAIALELELACSNSMCLDGHGIEVRKQTTFPRGIRST